MAKKTKPFKVPFGKTSSHDCFMVGKSSIHTSKTPDVIIQECAFPYEVSEEGAVLNYMLKKSPSDLLKKVVTLVGDMAPQEDCGPWQSDIWYEPETYDACLDELEKYDEDFPSLKEVVKDYAEILRILEETKNHIKSNTTADGASVEGLETVFHITNKNTVRELEVRGIGFCGFELKTGIGAANPWFLKYEDSFSTEEAARSQGLKTKLEEKRSKLIGIKIYLMEGLPLGIME